MTGWLITFVNGEKERTPDGTDMLRTSPDGQRLHAMAERSYGPNEMLKTYILVNVRSYEPTRK